MLSRGVMPMNHPACALFTAALAVVACVVGCPLAALAAASLTISPPSGIYVATEGFDLVLLVTAPGLTIVGGQVTVDGTNVTTALGGCLVPGTLPPGGQTFRCPGLRGSFLGAGAHTLTVSLSFSDGTTVARAVTWTILTGAGPERRSAPTPGGRSAPRSARGQATAHRGGWAAVTSYVYKYFSSASAVRLPTMSSGASRRMKRSSR